MKRQSKRLRLAASALLISATGAAHVAAADSINTRFFVPSSGFDYVYSEDALMDARQGWGLGLTFDYEKDPLVRINAAGTAESATLISDLYTLDAMATYRLGERWKLGLAVPLHRVTPEGASTHVTLGDSKPFAKYRLTPEDSPTAVALMTELRLPTGNGDYYLSDTSLGAGFRLVIEHDFKVLKLAGNAGFMYAAHSRVPSEGINYMRRVPLSLSAMIPLSERWAINAEGEGALPIPLNPNQNPGEAYLGGRYRWNESLVGFFGGAIGNFNGIGSDDYRLIAGLRFALDRVTPATPSKSTSEVKTPATPLAETSKPAPKPAPKSRAVFTGKTIEISEQVNFQTGKDVLTASGRQLLDEVAQTIKAHLADFRKLQIEGHTDRHGSASLNLKLSKARAAAVKQYLVGRGIDGRKLESEGYGKTRPKADAEISPAQQDAINRRVEFKVIQ